MFDQNNIMPRYTVLASILTLVAIAVVAKAGYIMTVKKDYWMKVADRVKADSVTTSPTRGNILASDGQLLASTLPEFKIYLDFQQIHEAGTDTLFLQKRDSVCQGLHDIFPSMSAKAFKARLDSGFNARVKEGKHKGEKVRYWPIWPKRIDYSTYMRVKQLPFFSMSVRKSGFGQDEFAAREKPYGSLARHTIGDVYKERDGGRRARCGLELSYDSLLRGSDGISHRRKVLNKYLSITDTPPINGCDIVTTIDVDMQDLAERAVISKLKDIDGDVGVAIVMDVRTGDIKAIVNQEKCADGVYREIQNHAVDDLMEPGSVFKTASMMTYLEDGVCDTTEMIETGSGVWHIYGRDMKDSHWRSGGYGRISLGRAMELSSNVGISYIANKYYYNNPEKYVRGIYRTGINDPNISIPIVGHARPHIPMPKKAPNGQWLNWSKTALLWMSIGYETQVPPIYTLTFYNAIANNGCMMQPRFVKAAMHNGDTIVSYPPQPVPGREQIASDKTIKIMQDLLHRVVVNGTGKKANSPNFWVCGKTGTAMIANNGSYRGIPHHLLSFAGWFGEQDRPYYSCIVCIQKTGLPAYGWMSGEVFKTIAEGVMAKHVRYDVTDSKDEESRFIPDVLCGNILSADYVLSSLGIKTITDFSVESTRPVWGMAESRKGSVKLVSKGKQRSGIMPDVHGMGARDAVYIIESAGVKCIIKGRGKVTAQSIGPGQKVAAGQKCVITLS